LLVQAALQLVDSLSEGEDWNDSGGNRGATEEVGRQEVNKLPADDLADGWFYKDPQGEIQGNLMDFNYFLLVFEVNVNKHQKLPSCPVTPSFNR